MASAPPRDQNRAAACQARAVEYSNRSPLGPGSNDPSRAEADCPAPPRLLLARSSTHAPARGVPDSFKPVPSGNRSLAGRRILCPSPRYLPTVPVKISRPYPDRRSRTGHHRAAPAQTLKLPVPLTTSHTAPWTRLAASVRIGLQRAAGTAERCRDRRTFAASAGLAAPAERRLADDGNAEDLARVAFGVGDARLDQDRVAAHRSRRRGLLGRRLSGSNRDRPDIAAVVTAAGREATCCDRQGHHKPRLAHAPCCRTGDLAQTWPFRFQDNNRQSLPPE